MIEFFGYVAGEADASVGGGVAGEVALVHADGAVDAEEIEHFGAFEAGAGGLGVFAVVDVLADDVAVGVLVIAVE